jgi:hypothetical protein
MQKAEGRPVALNVVLKGGVKLVENHHRSRRREEDTTHGVWGQSQFKTWHELRQRPQVRLLITMVHAVP